MHFFFLSERNIATSLLIIHLKCTVAHYANLNSSSTNKPSNTLFRFLICIFQRGFCQKLYDETVIFHKNFQNSLYIAEYQDVKSRDTNQTRKFDQSIEYNQINIFLQESSENKAGKLLQLSIRAQIQQPFRMTLVNFVTFVTSKISNNLFSMQDSLNANNCWRKQNFENCPYLYIKCSFRIQHLFCLVFNNFS